MINLQITGRNYDIDEQLNKYIQNKLGKLDRFFPRAHRPKGMRVEIFKDPSGKEDNRYRCVAYLEVPGPDITAETAMMNPHAAVDVVEAKLKAQIRRYKEKHSNRRITSIKNLIKKSTPTE